ncbi:MAG TPA: cytidine deaminase [Tenuifilaceae bacterium]|nr:cytidine deaminase [Tenuifilaceae bacterium]HPQ35285.1 cytidine deaminase [Tenuifilaceae bacterium]
MSKKKDLSYSYTEYASINELPVELANLAQKAIDALKTSYSPYSHFAVGAAVLLKNGEIIQGSNQENGAYPSGLCAERVALFYAGAKFPKIPVVGIAVAAEHEGKPITEPVAPCGSCRQVMLETSNIGKEPMKIVMIGKKRIVVVDDISHLLPFSFSSVIDILKE